MNIHRTERAIGTVVLLLLATAVLWPGIAIARCSANCAPFSGNQVVKRGRYRDNVYAVGRSVLVDAVVGGDVVAVGSDVFVSGTVHRDDLVVGGDVGLKGKVDDDVRAAGLSVAVDLRVGGDLLAAGSKIRTSAATRVGGHAWFAGGSMDLAGDFARDLVAKGSRIRLSGHVHGSANLTADVITLLPGTVIDGNLTYRSPHVLTLGKEVIVRGTVTRKPYPASESGPASSWAGSAIVFYIALYLSALVFTLVFANFSSAAAERLRSRPLASLGLGFAVLVATPAAAILSLVLVVTYLPGLVLLALYPAALLAGLVIGMVWLGELGLRVLHRGTDISAGIRALSLVTALVVLILVDFIPVFGGFAWLFLMVFGLGAGALQLARQYSNSP